MSINEQIVSINDQSVSTIEQSVNNNDPEITACKRATARERTFLNYLNLDIIILVYVILTTKLIHFKGVESHVQSTCVHNEKSQTCPLFIEDYACKYLYRH